MSIPFLIGCILAQGEVSLVTPSPTNSKFGRKGRANGIIKPRVLRAYRNGFDIVHGGDICQEKFELIRSEETSRAAHRIRLVSIHPHEDMYLSIENEPGIATVAKSHKVICAFDHWEHFWGGTACSDHCHF